MRPLRTQHDEGNGKGGTNRCMQVQITTFWCYPKGPCNKVSVSQCVRGARTARRRRTQWSPVLGREAKLRPWGKNTPVLTVPVWDKASATSRPCQRAVALVSATLMLAGVRLFCPALNPMGSRMSSLLSRWASFESLIPPGDWFPSPT